MRRLEWDQVSELRKLVDPAVDAVLYAAGRSLSGGGVKVGYPTCSSSIFGGARVQSFDDMAEDVDRAVGVAARSIIYDPGFLEIHRRALSVVYWGGAWREEGDLQVAVLQAADAFERRARAKGLV